MRILWLKSDLLLPLDKGGRLRTWHLMRQLARRHEITYLSFAETAMDTDDLAGMRQVASRVITVARDERPKGSIGFYVNAARYIADALPYAVAAYRSPAYRHKIEELLEQQRFHLIVCDFLVPAVNLPHALPCPAVLFTHNVESEIWRRHADTHSNAIVRRLYGTQYQRMLRFEESTLQRFDGILTVSQSDRDTFMRLYPDAQEKPMWIVPTGVDTEYFAPHPPAPAAEPQLVFTGSMDWLPNEDAMQFFCRDVLPLVRAAEPRVTLSIVGRAPTPAVRALAGADVVVTGTVDDVRPFMREAAVYVVPLRIGGGTRLKIFEAMAMGSPVVSTTIGAEGLPITHGIHALIADGPQPFADAVLALLRDPRRRASIGNAGRALVVDRFDWSAVAGTLEAALTKVATSGHYHLERDAEGRRHRISA